MDYLKLLNDKELENVSGGGKYDYGDYGTWIDDYLPLFEYVVNNNLGEIPPAYLNTVIERLQIMKKYPDMSRDWYEKYKKAYFLLTGQQWNG